MFFYKNLHRVLFFALIALLTLFSTFVGIFGSASAASKKNAVTAASYQKSSSANAYSKVDQYRGLGEVTNWAVGASSNGQGQQIYVSYKYYKSTFELVEADPFTGNYRVHTSPIANEWGANAEVTGSDGNIYLGTSPHATWVSYTPATDKMSDLGQASKTEQYIWDATTGADHNIYGVTYPHAKLVKLNPTTHKMSDLGSMDPKQLYARHIAASSDGFLYIGIGSAKSMVVAYNIATGKHKAIVSSNRAGFADVYEAIDHHVYAKLPNGTIYKLSGWSATPIVAAFLSPAKPIATLSDGSVVGAVGNQISVYQAGQRLSHTIDYAGKGVDLFRLALGPDGNVYGSTVLPSYLISLNIAKSATPARIKTLGELNYSQVYSFMHDSSKLNMAGYGYQYPLAAVDISHAGSTETTPVYNSGYTNKDLRPTSMVQGPNNNVYIGGIPGYGKLGGPLVQWNTGTGSTQESIGAVKDQSIYSLTMANGKVVGGTTIYGGYGSTPTQSRAKLFVWNPVTHRNEFEAVPTSNATYVSNLITAPNGLVYGFANSTLFIFNPVSKKITIPGYSLPVNTYVYNLLNNMAIGSDGNIWGLSTSGVYKINIATNKVTIFPTPVTITGCFVFVPNKVKGDTIYFASHSYLYKFQVR